MFLGATVIEDKNGDVMMVTLGCLDDDEEETWIADTGASCTCIIESRPTK